MNTVMNYTQLASLLKNGLMHDETKFEHNHDFEIHTLEWLETHRPLNDNTVKLNYFEVIWIKRGKGVLQVNGVNHDFADNFIYCIAPGNIRRWLTNTRIEGHYISFTRDFIRLSEGYSNSAAWLEQYDNHYDTTAILIDQEMEYELEVIVRKMKREYNNYFTRRLELLKGLLNIFMIYFSRNLKEISADALQSREMELVRKFMSFLKKNFVTKKMVSDYADHLCVTPNYLNRTVKKNTGYTASYHIQQQIVLEAKRQAMYSNISMKEIAYNLGFDNLAHFSKFFKNNCGMNFTNFKKGIVSHD